MSSWSYRLVRANGGVSVRVVWYDDSMDILAIESEDATVSVDPDWCEGDETEVDLIREELAKFSLALTLPILSAPATIEEEV